MLYGILKVVKAEAQRQLNSNLIGEEYRAALTAMIAAIERVMVFN